jgi:hypothetical protein
VRGLACQMSNSGSYCFRSMLPPAVNLTAAKNPMTGTSVAALSPPSEHITTPPDPARTHLFPLPTSQRGAIVAPDTTAWKKNVRTPASELGQRRKDAR